MEPSAIHDSLSAAYRYNSYQSGTGKRSTDINVECQRICHRSKAISSFVGPGICWAALNHVKHSHGMTVLSASGAGRIFRNLFQPLAAKQRKTLCGIECSYPCAVISRFADLPDPFLHLVVGLLPNLEILYTKPRGTEHWDLHIHS